MTTATRRSMVFERVYEAPVEELWALWTTKDGFESWWGPEGFRADVHHIDARQDGVLHYDMVADTPDAIDALKRLGRPKSHESRGRFSTYAPHERLVLTHVIDFVPGVPTYESVIEIDFFPSGRHTRMVVTLRPMHDEEYSGMQGEGFGSQLTKLDRRYGRGDSASTQERGA